MESAQFSTEGYGPMRTSIFEKLKDKFNPTHLEIIDDTPSHKGHVQRLEDKAGKEETHLKVIVVSDFFDKMLPIDRHRAV